MTAVARGRGRPILTAALAATGVTVLGAVVTEIGPWYQALRKPSWQPPDWLFGPVWTLIFALCAIAGVYAWRAARGTNARPWIIILFALNAALNVGWSLLFFRMHRPDWALYETGFLWLSVLLLIVFLGRYSRLAGWLLVPYLLWVSFASVLNWEIVRLNAPF